MEEKKEDKKNTPIQETELNVDAGNMKVSSVLTSTYKALEFYSNFIPIYEHCTFYCHFLYFCFVCRPHLAVLGDYSRPYAKRLFLYGSRDHTG